MNFKLEILAECTETRARAGVFHTPRGDIPTPVFAPVGTQATVKALTPRHLHELDAPMILCNAYHLYLRPGANLIAELGGLHKFMAWDRPILTDSGGFQVMSLTELRKITEDGVHFQSHIDGSRHFYTPELVIDIQEKLGSTIMMVLDECTPNPCEYEYECAALGRTHRWAERCLAAKTRDDLALFAIQQGGTYPELRAESATYLSVLDFDGYALGGLSVGETKAEMHEILDVSIPIFPAPKPRYLMGVGTVEDFFEAVARGVDIFDCVLPTRMARNGAVLVDGGRLNMLNACHKDDPRPIDEGCECYACQNFSRAYLRHLFKSKEILGAQLATMHNVHYLLNWMRRIRGAILAGNFAELRAEFWGMRRET